MCVITFDSFEREEDHNVDCDSEEEGEVSEEADFFFDEEEEFDFFKPLVELIVVFHFFN